MEKVCSYEQYAQISAEFKSGKPICSTNKLMTRDELEALIAADKLYYAEIDGVLWFFVHEGYYYSANFFVPADANIHMHGQDMDVLVELTGNQRRYNEKWEQELIAAGYQKGDKRLEWSARIEDILDTVQEQDAVRSARFKERGFFYRKATRSDAAELEKLWEDRLGKERHVLTQITEAEWNEMEKFGRCDVICTSSGEIAAAYVYKKQNKIGYAFHAAALYQGQGLGSAVLYRLIKSAYEAGCAKFSCWIREDNAESIKMHRHVLNPTGKYYWQFVYRAKKKE